MKPFRRGLVFLLLVGTTAVAAGCGQPVATNKPIPQPEQTAQVAPASPNPGSAVTNSSNPATDPAAGSSAQPAGSAAGPGSAAPAAATSVASGKEVFDKNCAACHGANATGGTGPALNKSTLSSGAPKNMETLVDSIKKGNIPKGMLSWQNVLPDSDIEAVAKYIMSLK